MHTKEIAEFVSNVLTRDELDELTNICMCDIKDTRLLLLKKFFSDKSRFDKILTTIDPSRLASEIFKNCFQYEF